MSTVELTSDLCDLIRYQRKEIAGLSQRQAALAAGDMSEVWWRTIESCRVPRGVVPAETLARMCFAIDIDPAQLARIGQPVVGRLVERRRSLLAPPVSIAQDPAEAAIRRIPDLDESEKTALVSYLRTLRSVASNEASAG